MPFILPANTLSAGGYDVDNSLRFDEASTTFLSKASFGTPTSTQKSTISFWCKRSLIEEGIIFMNDSATFPIAKIYFDSSHRFSYIEFNPSTTALRTTNAVYRDVSAWYHFVVSVDTTQATAGNRIKIYVNGVQETSFESSTNPSEDASVTINDNLRTGIGGTGAAGGDGFEGYISELVRIDGQALAADSFGEFDEDSGIWKPIDVSGLTFGDNGFYLETKQSGTSQNSSGLGADTSGNDNHFAVNNLTAVDQSTDTCTNNFATMNSLDTNSNHTFSEGNLKTVYSAAAGTFGVTKGTIGVSAGKWYWEVKYTYGNAGQFGFFNVNDSLSNTVDIFSAAGAGTFNGLAWRIDTSNNIKEVGFEQSADTGVDFASGNILGIAFDADNGKLYGFKNGAELSGQDISAGTSLMTAVTVSDFYLPFISNGDGGSGTKTGTSEVNFGSPSFAISSSNADANGFGNFEYAVPSGYFSLNTKNLAEFG